MPQSFRVGRTALGDGLIRETNLPPSTSFTWMAWICRRGVGDSGGGADPSIFILSLSGHAAAPNDFAHCYDLAFRGTNSGGGDGATPFLYNGNDSLESTNGGLTQDRWYHLAVTVSGTSGSNFLLYRDGVLDIAWDARDIATGAAGTPRMAMGVDHRSNVQWIDASLAAVKIYNRALTAGEINAEMRSAMPVSWEGLNSAYPFPSETDRVAHGPELLRGALTRWQDVGGIVGSELLEVGTIDTDLGPPVPFTLDPRPHRATTATASTTITGVSSQSLPLGGTSTGQLELRAASSTTLSMGATSTGKVDLRAASSVALPISGAATGTVELRASSAAALPLTGSASGVLPLAAASSTSLPLVSTSTGTLALAGVSSVMLPLVPSSAGVMSLQGTSSATLALSALSTGALELRAGSSQFLPLTVDSTGFSGSGAQSTQTLPLTATSSGALAVQGISSVTLSLASLSAATLELRATSTTALLVTSVGAGRLDIGSASAVALVIASAAAAGILVRGFSGVLLQITALSRGTLSIPSIGLLGLSEDILPLVRFMDVLPGVSNRDPIPLVFNRVPPATR